MMHARWLRFVVPVMLAAVGPLPAEEVGRACDGSAIFTVGGGYFLNATDEDNVIRLYRLGSATAPVREFDMSGFLAVEKTKKGVPKEADLEGVAKAGNRLYWIGSHGRDKKGDKESSRHRLFATTVSGAGADTQLAPAGKPFQGLIARLSQGNSEAAAALRAAEAKPHLNGGIDVEGLAAGPNGSLLIGFRSPLVANKAILTHLVNAAAVLDKGEKPTFDKPILLDLGGLGIRDIVPTGKAGEYWILAGLPGEGSTFKIYRGQKGAKPVVWKDTLPAGPGAPEGLMADESGKLLLSRDGGEIGSPACKDRPVKERRFELVGVP
ncbi:MAG: DUF3616 domain-containing protein [Bryobacterales bacterium]|nr:DUF3616 domain-containing protein [Bryobacterales bacterium]